jgi:hypothetical protein
MTPTTRTAPAAYLLSSLPDEPAVARHDVDPVALRGALVQAARRLIESAQWALAEPDFDPAMVLLLQEEWGHVQRWRGYLAGVTKTATTTDTPGLDANLEALLDRAAEAFAELVAAANRVAARRDEAPV